MITPTPDVLASMLLAFLANDALPSEDDVRTHAARLCEAYKLPTDTVEAVVRIVLAKRFISMAPGFAIQEQHDPWLEARRPEIDPYYWSRYKQYLALSLAPSVLTTIDRSTDEILNLCGNPSLDMRWKRRGLVMGDVQSGKTGTYSGLICKAADAGYKFIVLLTGTIETLRRQTQSRLDESFCGFDSSAFLKPQGIRQAIGVGRQDMKRWPAVFTSTSSDFRSDVISNLGLHLTSLSEPALVVVKKHARILDNLEKWLRLNNLHNDGDQLQLPFLLIDDEADNASVNTNDEGCDPTRINACIRKLLSLFARSSYVGITATPFANIFIHPESAEASVGDDLFPRDFIYALQPPSNYQGASALFEDPDGRERHLRTLDDIEAFLPRKHNSNSVVGSLPPSLLEALNTFALTNALRDLRGEGPSHRSMLVNVSPYTRVQQHVEARLRVALDSMSDSIRNFAGLPVEEALRDPVMKGLHSTYKTAFPSATATWQEVQMALRAAVLPITTRCVNRLTGPNTLNYATHKTHGLRVIAVGGNSLSRGLTLEGLSTSYFRRTSLMYDTLLQMGRWFGYRDGYDDLCRLWLPSEAIDWFGHISEATHELKMTLLAMHGSGRTPKDFGLRVRAHPDSLLVTARNKMRSSQSITWWVSLSNQSFESVELLADDAALASTFDLAENWLNSTLPSSTGPQMVGTTSLYRGIPRSRIGDLLHSFRSAESDIKFQPQRIAELLANTHAPELDTWDVAIPQGNGPLTSIGPLPAIHAQERPLLRASTPDRIIVSGNKRRLNSRGVEKLGLTEAQIAAAHKDAKDAAIREGKPIANLNVSDFFYRNRRTRPLLVLHVLAPSKTSPTTPPLPTAPPVIGIALSFPPIADAMKTAAVKYVLNTQSIRELFGAPDTGDDTDDVPQDLQ